MADWMAAAAESAASCATVKISRVLRTGSSTATISTGDGIPPSGSNCRNQGLPIERVLKAILEKTTNPDFTGLAFEPELAPAPELPVAQMHQLHDPMSRARQ